MLETVIHIAQITQDVAQIAPAELATDYGDIPAKPPEGLQSTTDKLIGWLKWGGVTAGTFGLAICGIMMAIGRKNRSHMAAEGASGIPWVIGGLSLVSLAGGIVSSLV